MMLKYFIFISAISLSLASDIGVDERKVVPEFIRSILPREKECIQDGYMCDDCNTSVRCVELMNGEFYKFIVGTCEGLETCQPSTGLCSPDPNPECSPSIIDYEFKCIQVGIFPNPFDCKKYHICLDNANGAVIEAPRTYECINGYGYDPNSGLCRRVLVNNTCPEMIQPCESSKQSGLISGTTYMYYRCIANGEKYFPQIFVCRGGTYFINDTCAPPETGLDANNKCERSGNFFYPNDCKRYRECLGTGRDPTLKTCSSGNEFDKFTRVCRAFRCP